MATAQHFPHARFRLPKLTRQVKILHRRGDGELHLLPSAWLGAGGRQGVQLCRLDVGHSRL